LRKFRSSLGHSENLKKRKVVEKIIYKHIVKEVSVSKKDGKSFSMHKRNGWIVVYEGKFGYTLRKTEIEGDLGLLLGPEKFMQDGA